MGFTTIGTKVIAFYFLIKGHFWDYFFKIHFCYLVYFLREFQKTEHHRSKIFHLSIKSKVIQSTAIHYVHFSSSRKIFLGGRGWALTRLQIKILAPPSPHLQRKILLLILGFKNVKIHQKLHEDAKIFAKNISRSGLSPCRKSFMKEVFTTIATRPVSCRDQPGASKPRKCFFPGPGIPSINDLAIFGFQLPALLFLPGGTWENPRLPRCLRLLHDGTNYYI